jgi:hypothetical protein
MYVDNFLEWEVNKMTSEQIKERNAIVRKWFLCFVLFLKGAFVVCFFLCWDLNLRLHT